MPIRSRTSLTPSRKSTWRVPATRSTRSRSDLERRLKTGLERYACDVPEAAFPTFLESLYFESLGGASPRPSPGKGRIAS